jgi:hypothetical protein
MQPAARKSPAPLAQPRLGPSQVQPRYLLPDNARAVAFWDQQPATTTGILFGYDGVHAADIRNSLRLLDSAAVRNHISGFELAIDIGSGPGRVVQAVLLKRFTTVDLSEPAPSQLAVARTVAGVRNCFAAGLHDFAFAEPYDCIWLQWVLCFFLEDSDLLAWLAYAKRAGLRRKAASSGLLCIKENVADARFVDKTENAVTRT